MPLDASFASLFDKSGFVDGSSGASVVANEMIAIPFLSEALCSNLIDIAEASQSFAVSGTDPVPGVELSLRRLSPMFLEQVEEAVGRQIWPRLQQHWPMIDYYGLQDAFIIKYHLQGQTELRLHHDLAQLSGSVKLNTNYTGAELDFPRQGYSNRELPAGTLLVWPSLVTHPHRSTPLTSGTKYSLTLWFELPLQLS